MLDPRIIDLLEKIKDPCYSFSDFLEMSGSNLVAGEKPARISKDVRNFLIILYTNQSYFGSFTPEELLIAAALPPFKHKSNNVAFNQKISEEFLTAGNTPKLKTFVERWFAETMQINFKKFDSKERLDLYREIVEKGFYIVQLSHYKAFRVFFSEDYISLKDFELFLNWLPDRLNELTDSRFNSLKKNLKKNSISQNAMARIQVNNLIGEITRCKTQIDGSVKDWRIDLPAFSRAISISEASRNGMRDFSIETKMAIFGAD